MLRKNGRICLRIVEKCANTYPTKQRNPHCLHSSNLYFAQQRCHSSHSECRHGVQPVSPHPVSLHPVSLNPSSVRGFSTRRPHTTSNLSYTRGSDSDKAKEFLLRYHEETMKKYGVPEEERDRDKTSMQGNNQCRVTPRFLVNAQFFNGRYYFCHPDPETGWKRLVRFRMTTGEDITLCKDLDSLSEVRELAESGPYLAVLMSSDRDSRIIVISEETGSVVRSLKSGHQIQWISDNSLLYTTINHNMRPDTVVYCNLESGKQETVYKSDRSNEVVSVTCSKDRMFTAVNVNTKLTSHVILLDNETLDSRGGGGGENVVCSRKQNSKCYIEHHKDRLIAIKSAPDSPNLHLHWSAPIDKTPGSEPTYPQTDTFTAHPGNFGVIQEMEAFDRGIVLYHTTLDNSGYRGTYRMTLLDPGDYSKTLSVIEFPPDVSLVSPNSNSSPGQTHLNICVHSYTKPVKHLSIPFSKFKISRGRLISRGRYEMITDTVPSGDANVPITILAKEDALTECTPCLFLTYGCYGESLFHSLETLPRELLDRGWKVVLCHVRGGGEMGRNWYIQGIGSKKSNSVLDTLNCMKHVQTLNLTTPSLSTLHSSSSGALIAARAAQSVPGIASKLVLRLPFLDLDTAMSDPLSPLSSEEIEEWGYHSEDGSPGLNPLEFSDTASDSDVFITVAGLDRRAPCWHAANYIASNTNGGRVFVNFLEDTDHTGFGEEAATVETNFILDRDRSRTSSLWNRLKGSLFSK